MSNSLSVNEEFNSLENANVDVLANHLLLLLGRMTQQAGDLDCLLGGSCRSRSRRKRRTTSCAWRTTSSRSSARGGTSRSIGTICSIRSVAARRTRWTARRRASRIAGHGVALRTAVARHGRHTRDLGSTIPATTHHIWWEAVITTARALRRVASTRREVHRSIQVTIGDAGSGSLLHSGLVALSDQVLELLATNITALSKRDVQWLVTDHLVVHLRDGLGGLVGTGVANEAKALGVALVVAHDLGAGNGPERLELGAKFVVVHVVIDVLDVKVHALPLGEFLHLSSLERAAELFLTLLLLLSTGNEEPLAIDLLVVEGFDCSRRLIVGLEINETKAFVLAVIVDLNDSGGDHAVRLKHLLEPFESDVGVNVLDVKIGVLSTNLLELGLPLLWQGQGVFNDNRRR